MWIGPGKTKASAINRDEEISTLHGIFSFPQPQWTFGLFFFSFFTSLPALTSVVAAVSRLYPPGYVPLFWTALLNDTTATTTITTTARLTLMRAVQVLASACLRARPGSARVRTGLVLIKVHHRVWTQRTRRPRAPPLGSHLLCLCNKCSQRQHEWTRAAQYYGKMSIFDR